MKTLSVLLLLVLSLVLLYFSCDWYEADLQAEARRLGFSSYITHRAEVECFSWGFVTGLISFAGIGLSLGLLFHVSPVFRILTLVFLTYQTYKTFFGKDKRE